MTDNFYTNSFTPLAVQRNWRTPNAFPSCPDKITDKALKTYLEELTHDSIFAHNKYGESLVEIAALSMDGFCLSVVARLTNGVKGWALAKVTIEEGAFVHEACGTFFTREGAEKRHCELIGKPWEGEDTIDDYC